jgi:hypothetical protein
MTLLLDTSLWIDFTRARSPAPLKQFIAPFVLDPEGRLLDAQFATFPTLSTPGDLWPCTTAPYW